MRWIYIAAILLLFKCSLTAQPNQIWEWAVQAGGVDDDRGNSITADSLGNCYVTGCFQNTATFGPETLISTGSYDIFVAKLDPEGNYLWTVQAGGIGADDSKSIILDNEGFCYITGYFSGTAVFGSITLDSYGSSDLYLAKLDPEGDFLWVTQGGGLSSDTCNDLALDNLGNCYATGSFSSTAEFGEFTLSSSDGSDIFVAKLDSNGSFIWVAQAGGTSNDSSGSIAIDNNGNSYITGNFYGDAVFGATTLANIGTSADIFIAKVDSLGSFLWANQAGDESWDRGNGIATDNNGNCYVVGSFRDTIAFDAFSLTSHGEEDFFVAKLDTNGNYIWVTQTGGTEPDNCNDIFIDSDGSIYLTGYFSAFTVFGPVLLHSYGFWDTYVTKLDSEGSFLWVKRAGSASSENGNSVYCDNIGNCYLTGYFYGTIGFDGTFLFNSGEGDVFITKLSSPTNVTEGNQPAIYLNGVSSYPNPFYYKTSITYNLPKSGHTRVCIYNVKGQLVASLLDTYQISGEHSLEWDGRNQNGRSISSGIYMCRIMSSGEAETHKMLLIK
jgi:hypothetical protein